MGKRIFWIFLLTVLSVTALAVVYVQSESFARLAKEHIQERAAETLGLGLHFDRLRIGVLPPSLSLVNVDVQVLMRENALGLSPRTVFKVAKLGFSFRMIQAFSGGVAINKVFVDQGDLHLDLPKSKGGPGEKLSELVHRPINLRLGDGFNVSIRQIELKNTLLDLSWLEGTQISRVFIKRIAYLAVTPSSAGSNVTANLEEAELSLPKVKESLRALKLNADVQRNEVRITNLDLQRKEAALHSSGRLAGSIDSPEDLRAEVDLILRTPIHEFSDFEPKLKQFSGEALVDLKVTGRLRDPALSGKAEISKFRYGLWELEKLLIAGSYESGTLALERFEAHRAGGNVSLKSKVEVPIPFRPEPKTLQLGFHQFKFEEFAGDLKKDVNNLKLQADGSLSVRAEFASGTGNPKLQSLSLRPELRISELELNNQSYGKSRPYKRIFKVAPFQAVGNVVWKNGEVRVTDAKLTLATGEVDVRGSVSGKGYDLYGTAEQVDIGREIGDIGGIPASGQGYVRLHVHGPGNAVLIDFDLRQRDAKFVRFDFGEINGRVTYDDGSSYIIISDLTGQKNKTKYTVSGKVNVGSGEDLSLKAMFRDGDPNDVFAIFQHQLRDISWIPHGMTGSLSADVTVGGTYTNELQTLEIAAQTKGKNLSYLGEMVHAVDAQAGVSKGVIYARNVTGQKYETPFTGELDYKLATDELRYVLSAERGKLRNLDFLGAMGLPVDGLFRLRSEGRGRWETLESKTRFETMNAFARTKPLPAMRLDLDTFADRSAFAGSIGEDIKLDIILAASPRAESSAEWKFGEGNLDYLLCVLSRANCTSPSPNFHIRGGGRFTWRGNDWLALSGSGELREFSLAKPGYSIRNPAPVPIRAANGMLEADRFSLEGDGTKLKLHLRGRVDASELDNQVQGDLSLKLLEFITPLIEEARGKAAVDLSLRGNSTNSQISGLASIQDGFLRLTGLDAPVDNLGGRLKVSNSRVTFENFDGRIGGGTVQVAGGLNLYLNRAPQFDIDVFLANNRVKFFPVNFAEIADAKLSFAGDHPPYLLSGTANVKRVMMRNNFSVGGQKGLQHARYLPDRMGGSRGLYEVKIRAVAESGVMVENDLLNAEFKGEVTLLNNFEFPQIIMRGELVRGRLQFRNTPFTLGHATIRNPSPELFNPQFSIGGNATVDNYQISIFASGTTDKPKIILSSNPPMPQEDIVSLLAFGYRGEDAKKLNPADSNNIAYSEVGSILLEQLQLNQNLQQRGLKVMVVPSLTQTEQQVIRPHTSPGQASPKVYVQTQIVKNLEASFGGSVGATQGQAVDGRLEYRLGRKASVSAIYEQTPGLDATEVRNSFGGDLKFRWGFR